MASNENHFGLLSASQDPTQDVNKASNAARNRKKKERRNQKKTVEPISADETTADPDEQTQGHKGVKTSLSQVCKEFVRDASQMDCWQAWDRWIREIKEQKSNARFSDGNGRNLDYREALLHSGAFPLSISNAVTTEMQPGDRKKLENVLSTCLPGCGASCAEVADVLFEVSTIVAAARPEAKQSRKVQNTARHSVQAVIRALQASTSAALPLNDSVVNGSKHVADLRALDKRISGKMAVVSKAIAQNDSASPALIEASTDAVRMLKQKYDALQGHGGLDAADLSECKAATQSLAHVLESQLVSAATSNRGRAAVPSTNARDIALIDANISKLSARIRGLEGDLQDTRSELHAAQMRRATLEMPVGRAAPQVAPSAGADRARDLAKRLDVQFTAALGGGVVEVGESEETLHTLLESCQRCALLHDKHMERLAEQLDFAQHRAAAATNLGDPSKRDAANKMVLDLRGQSSHTHDAAARLEQLVESLDGHINTSSSFSTLRPILMQVKQIVWKVHSAHNVLVTSGQPGALSTAGPGGKKAMTMEEILQSNVKATSAPRRQPPAQVPAAPEVVPAPVATGRPQQVMATQRVPLPRAPAPFSTARPQVHAASHGGGPGITAYSAIAAPRLGTLSAPVPLGEPVPAPIKQVLAPPVDAHAHTVQPQGPPPCSMPVVSAPVYAAQPAPAPQQQMLQPADASQAAGTSYSSPVLMAAEGAAARLRMAFGQAATQAPAAGRGLPGRAGGRGGRGRGSRPGRV